MNVGLLVISAMSAMGILGIILAGWSSNSHYSLLGGLRSSAQVISYEVAIRPGADVRRGGSTSPITPTTDSRLLNFPCIR